MQRELAVDMGARPGATIRRGRWFATAYCGAIIVTSSFGDPTGLTSIPVLFLLKDQLHFGAEAVALFETLILLPHYAAFLFGALRDRWSPWGLGDRGYYLFAAPVAVAAYIWLSTSEPGFYGLLAAVLVAMTSYQFIDTVSQSLMTVVGRRHAMTGRLSAFAELSESLALLGATFLGGWLVARSATRTSFLIAAGASAVIFGLGFLKPKAVFGARQADRSAPAGLRAVWAQVRYIWPVVAILALYYFSPSWGTPLFYYLTDDLHLSPEIYGACRAATLAGYVVATGLYGFLCVRYPLRRLLWWSLALNIAPGALLLLIGGSSQAIVISGVLGVVVGFANVCLFDLLMRSCPVDLEGSISMIGVSTLGLAAAVGDLAGAWVYERGGFAACIILDAAATLLVAPLLARAPRELIATRDGAAG